MRWCKVSVNVLGTKQRPIMLHFTNIPVYPNTIWRESMSNMVKRYAKEDFGLDIVTYEDLAKLRRLIRKRYMPDFGDIVNNQCRFDRYGFNRLWLLGHVEDAKR